MKTVENRWFGFVLFIALLFFCILMSLVPLLAGTTARADSVTLEPFHQASLDTSAGNKGFRPNSPHSGTLVLSKSHRQTQMAINGSTTEATIVAANIAY